MAESQAGVLATDRCGKGIRTGATPMLHFIERCDFSRPLHYYPAEVRLSS